MERNSSLHNVAVNPAILERDRRPFRVFYKSSRFRPTRPVNCFRRSCRASVIKVACHAAPSRVTALALRGSSLLRVFQLCRVVSHSLSRGKRYTRYMKSNRAIPRTIKRVHTARTALTARLRNRNCVPTFGRADMVFLLPSTLHSGEPVFLQYAEGAANLCRRLVSLEILPDLVPCHAIGASA